MVFRIKQKHPLLVSLFLAFVTILFMVFAGVIITVRGLLDLDGILVQSFFIWISAILGLFIMKNSDLSLSQFGLNLKTRIKSKKMFCFIPIIVIEIIPFFTGLNNEVTLKVFLILVLFSIGVGINEEIYYRGLILNLLESKGIKYAIIVSSLLFGLVHAFNLLGGKSLTYILLQILFATLFGFLCGEIAVLTGSLIIPIVWHSLHDLIALSTSQALDTSAIFILGIQSLILLIYAIYLWKNIDKLHKNEIADTYKLNKAV